MANPLLFITSVSLNYKYLTYVVLPLLLIIYNVFTNLFTLIFFAGNN